MLEIHSSVQFVAGSQPVNAVAFVVDGLYYGVSDFGYAAYSMVMPCLFRSIVNLLYPESQLSGLTFCAK